MAQIRHYPARTHVEFKVKANQIRMFKDRGIPVPESEQIFLDQWEADEEIITNQTVGINLDYIYFKPDTNERFFVIYISETVGKGKAITEEEMFQYVPMGSIIQSDHLLIVSPPLSAKKRKIASQITPDLNLELWLWDDLLINVPKHHLNPVVKIIDDPTEIDLIIRTATKQECLPAMYDSDPIARWYKLPVGTIVLWLRPYENFKHELPYYRIVKHRPLV